MKRCVTELTKVKLLFYSCYSNYQLKPIKTNPVKIVLNKLGMVDKVSLSFSQLSIPLIAIIKYSFLSGL